MSRSGLTPKLLQSPYWNRLRKANPQEHDTAAKCTGGGFGQGVTGEKKVYFRKFISRFGKSEFHGKML